MNHLLLNVLLPLKLYVMLVYSGFLSPLKFKYNHTYESIFEDHVGHGNLSVIYHHLVFWYVDK